MLFSNQLVNLRSFAILGILLLVSALNSFAGNYGEPAQRPVRLYYFGYGMTGQGFTAGTEFTISTLTLENVKCTHGMRVGEHKIILAPQLGLLKTIDGTTAAFANVEMDFKNTGQSGWIFELFASGGYAQVFEKNVTTAVSDSRKPVAPATTELNYGTFMPQAGIGTGYDFQKMNGRNVPLAINFRALTTTFDMPTSFFNPSFQAGLTYSF